MNKGLLFFDVDGTLVSFFDNKIPSSTLKALEQARKNGYRIYLNSGRVRCMLEDLATYINVDGIVCGCGTEIIDDGKIIYSFEAKIQDCKKLMQLMDEYKVEAILEAKDKVYTRKNTIVDVNALKELYSVIEESCELKRIDFNTHVLFDKFCVVALTNEENNRTKDFIQALTTLDISNKIDVIDREQGFYEFIPRGYDKGLAVNFLMDKYNISGKDTFVFGDSNNDISMFKSKALNKVVMGKHDKELINYASFITKTVEEDGVKYAMAKLGVI